MGFCAIYFLFMVKFAKKRWHWLKFVPETLVIVGLGTAISAIARLDQYNVFILGHIEQGIPRPSPPRLDLVEIIATFAGDAAVIALVGFVEHIVAGKTYAVKNGYAISANRELVALGSLNTIGSFFHAYPTFASVRPIDSKYLKNISLIVILHNSCQDRKLPTRSEQNRSFSAW